MSGKIQATIGNLKWRTSEIKVKSVNTIISFSLHQLLYFVVADFFPYYIACVK